MSMYSKISKYETDDADRLLSFIKLKEFSVLTKYVNFQTLHFLPQRTRIVTTLKESSMVLKYGVTFYWILEVRKKIFKHYMYINFIRPHFPNHNDKIPTTRGIRFKTQVEKIIVSITMISL